MVTQPARPGEAAAVQQVSRARPALRPRSRWRSPPGPGSARPLARPPTAQEVERAGPAGPGTRRPSDTAGYTRPPDPRLRAQVSLGLESQPRGRPPGAPGAPLLHSAPAPPDLGDFIAPRPLTWAESRGSGAYLP